MTPPQPKPETITGAELLAMIERLKTEGKQIGALSCQGARYRILCVTTIRPEQAQLIKTT